MDQMNTGQQELPTIEDPTEARARGFYAMLEEMRAKRDSGEINGRQASSYREKLLRGMEQLGYPDMVGHVERFLRSTGQTASEDGQNEVQSLRHWRMAERKVRELEQAFFAEDGEAELNAGIDLIWTVIGVLVSQGHDVRRAFREVSRANFDKEPPYGTPVTFNKDGFITKPDGWKPPQLAEYVGF